MKFVFKKARKHYGAKVENAGYQRNTFVATDVRFPVSLVKGDRLKIRVE